MKKILFAIILFIIPLALSAKWYGDGKSPSSAYYGVINGSNLMLAWDSVDYTGGVIYVGRSTSGQNDLEVGTGGTLSISHGVTVKFCTTSSDLRITGTGVLNASGSSLGYITFTKNAQATWGHITFEASTGTSVIDSCIIEHGSKTGSGIEGWGGGIHINTSNLTVSYCLIRDNTAVWGGGVFVNQSVAPTINNCHIYSNTATSSGGGLYLWFKSAPKMVNCIIDDNECTNTGPTYGGGGLGVYTGGTGNAKITNCIIVNNIHTSGTKRGDNIHINSTNAINFINCIVWSSDNSVYIDASPVSTNFINSAVQRVYNSSGEVSMSSYSNSFKLNSSNTGTNPDGPYFNATNGSDWSIQFRSPCRDAGISSGAPSTDYVDSSRIGPHDIGAYEVQYSRWKTDASTPDTWLNSGNWEQYFYPGIAGTTGDVAIPALSSDTYAPDIESITIASGKSVILEPGAKATFGAISNSGTLKLEADADSVASLILDAYTTDNGTEEIELYLTGGDAGDKDYRWHYVSSPVAALPVSTFAPTPTINFAQYIEGYPTDSLMQGWIAYDGYVYTTKLTDAGYIIIGTNLVVGQGYNYYDTEDYKFSFAGTLNTEDVIKAITHGGDATLHGFNLLGNPFSSGLNWDIITNDDSYPAGNTSKGVYFTRDNEQCTYINDVGIPGDVTGIIPPMQGFFIKTTGDNVIKLLAAARTHNSIHERYKGKSIIPLVRLSVTEYSVSDETVIRFDEQAKPELDNDFDALKMFLSDTKTSIYSYTDETKYAINGQPFPETVMEIPIVVNFVFGGIQMISAIQLQGLDNYHVALKDLETGFDVDLKTTPNLYFTASAGITTDRFVLAISNATGIEDIYDLPELFSVFAANSMINIRTLSDAWNGKRGTVRIFDLTGRTVSEIQNKEFWKNSILQVPAPSAKGIYFVEIRAGGERYVGKVSTGY